MPPGGTPIGPTFSRADLEHLASSRISDLFGPAFTGQDGFHRQVRMPMPPMLLADRVTGIERRVLDLTGVSGEQIEGDLIFRGVDILSF
jgi:hypothetical protein